MNEQKIYAFLTENGCTHNGAVALMGNLEAESGLRSDIAETYYMKKMGYTSEQYTKEVDNRTYTYFANDAVGYGLAQWTYCTRKKALLQFAERFGKSIGDLDMQLAYLIKELKTDYSGIWSALTDDNTDIRTLSDLIMVKFENPADKSESAKKGRMSRAMKFDEMFRNTASKAPASRPTLREHDTGMYVKEMQTSLCKAGFLRSGEADGIFGIITLGAVLAFQKKNGLEVDGICGPMTWKALLK